MGNGNGNGFKITRADIDRAALLAAKVKDYEKDVAEVKEKIRWASEPGGTVKGYTFMAQLSEIPTVKGKLDYKAELVKAIGQEAVDKLEAAAAMVLTEGTQRVTFVANPDRSQEDFERGKKLEAKLLKGIGDGKAAKQLVKELEEIVRS